MGGWFEKGGLRLHLGVERPFLPAKKVHPASETADFGAVIAVLQHHQIAFQPDADLPGFRRIYVADPFGSRLELLERIA